MVWKPDYITLALVKGFLRIDVGDTADDVELASWITAASRAVDRACNRQFGQDAGLVTRKYRQGASYDPDTGFWLLEIDDVQDTTGMTIDGVVLASSGVTLLPENAVVNGKPYERLGYSNAPVVSYGPRTAVTVLARSGWTAVPAQVPAACKLQINRWNARRESPFGIAGSPDAGSELRLLSKLDPDVATTLAGLKRFRKPG